MNFSFYDRSTPGGGDTTAAVAAERARALGWLYLGKTGVASLTFSDPAGLLSDHSVDPVTGAFQVTAVPGVQTATPDSFAGWEGRIYGPVDGVDFAAISQVMVARLIRDLAVTQTAESDLEAIVLFANGPRATATIGFGGGFRSTNSGSDNRRPVGYILRTTWTRSIGSTALTGATVQITGAAGGATYNANTRAVMVSSALSSTGAAGAGASSGTPIAPTEWQQVWVSVLFGRIVGDGIAPDSAAESARVMPVFTYTAPDWTLAEIPS